VQHELFPYVFGTVQASFANVDQHFSTTACKSYYIIREVYAPRDSSVPLAQQHMHEDLMLESIGEHIRKHGIPVPKHKKLTHTVDMHTVRWKRTFRKNQNARQKKKIQHQQQLLAYFERFTVPSLYDRAMINSDVLAKIAENALQITPHHARSLS